MAFPSTERVFRLVGRGGGSVQQFNADFEARVANVSFRLVACVKFETR